MARRLEDLIDWLGRDNRFPDGVILLTGTGIVPPDDFSLEAGDPVSITIDGLGTLTNPVEPRPDRPESRRSHDRRKRTAASPRWEETAVRNCGSHGPDECRTGLIRECDEDRSLLLGFLGLVGHGVGASGPAVSGFFEGPGALPVPVAAAPGSDGEVDGVFSSLHPEITTSESTMAEASTMP